MEEDNYVRFYQVPVGATFKWGNVSRFKKTRAVGPDDIFQDKMPSNCINLDNGHECIMSAIFKCYDVKEDS